MGRDLATPAPLEVLRTGLSCIQNEKDPGRRVDAALRTVTLVDDRTGLTSIEDTVVSWLAGVSVDGGQIATEVWDAAAAYDEALATLARGSGLGTGPAAPGNDLR